MMKVEVWRKWSNHQILIYKIQDKNIDNIVTLSFQDAIGTSAAFASFGVIGIFALVFIIWKVPETKGLSLEEIEAKFST